MWLVGLTGAGLPGSSAAEVRRLAGLEFMIEIEAIAFVDEGRPSPQPSPRKRGEGEDR